MNAHTPGPWITRMQRADNGDALGWIIETTKNRAGRIAWASRAYADTNEEAPSESPEVCGNACLIAAAPDLLQALDDLLLCIEVDALIPESVSFMRQARAAIAKATGAESKEAA